MYVKCSKHFQGKFSSKTSDLRTDVLGQSFHHANNINKQKQFAAVEKRNTSGARTFTGENTIPGDFFFRVMWLPGLLKSDFCFRVESSILHFKALKTNSGGAVLADEVGKMCTKL